MRPVGRLPRPARVLGAVVTAALGVAAITGSAFAAGSVGVFRGETSQGEAVEIVVGHRVVDGVGQSVVQESSTVRSTAACAGGGSLASTTHLRGLLQDGVFVLQHHRYSDPLSGGGRVEHTVTVHFVIHGDRLRGRFVNHAIVRRGGKVLARCTTGRLTIDATRDGATAQARGGDGSPVEDVYSAPR